MKKGLLVLGIFSGLAAMEKETTDRDLIDFDPPSTNSPYDEPDKVYHERKKRMQEAVGVIKTECINGVKDPFKMHDKIKKTQNGTVIKQRSTIPFTVHVNKGKREEFQKQFSSLVAIQNEIHKEEKWQIIKKSDSIKYFCFSSESTRVYDSFPTVTVRPVLEQRYLKKELGEDFGFYLWKLLTLKPGQECKLETGSVVGLDIFFKNVREVRTKQKELVNASKE